MIYGEDQPPNRTVEKIISERGSRPLGGDDAELHEYVAFERTGGNMPNAGFSLFQRGGKRHAFFYHNIANMDLTELGEDQEALFFTHQGKAVTIRGRGLHDVFDAIMEQKLQGLYEFHDVWDAPSQADPLIDRTEVTDIEKLAMQNGQSMRQPRQ